MEHVGNASLKIVAPAEHRVTGLTFLVLGPKVLQHAPPVSFGRLTAQHKLWLVVQQMCDPTIESKNRPPSRNTPHRLLQPDSHLANIQRNLKRHTWSDLDQMVQKSASILLTVEARCKLLQKVLVM